MIGKSLILLSALLVAAGSAAAQPEARPEVSAEQVGDVYVVKASFDLPPGVTREVAWQVLTDFSHIGRFVPSVRKSAVVGRDGAGLLLEQEVQGKLMMFSRTAHVLLRVTETPEQALEFVDVSRGDFELYRGGWALRAGQGGLRVEYLLRAKPRHGPPALLGTRAIDDGVADLLQGLRNEMEARAAQQAVRSETAREQ